jgi:hypothetical protein
MSKVKIEGEPTIKRSLFRRLGERMGIVPSPAQQEAQLQKIRNEREAYLAREARKDQLVMALIQAGVCWERICYFLGFEGITVDPHPGEPINFMPEYPPPAEYIRIMKELDKKR